MSIVDRLRTGFDWDYSEQNIGALIQYGDLTDEAADEIERLRAELNDATLEQAWAERNAAVAELHNHKETSQAREAKLRGALQTFIEEHEDCEDSDGWAAYMCSIDAVHEAENALDMPADDSALKELREALDLLWANANHEEWDAMAREHFERLIRGWK